MDFHDTHLTDLQITENPRSLISFPFNSFFATKMSEKVPYKPLNLKGMVWSDRKGREKPLSRLITMASSMRNDTSDQPQIQLVQVMYQLF